MQKLRQSLFAAIFLMAGPGCSKDRDNGAIKGQTCQAAKSGNPGAGGQYLCPEGYFCKYANEKDMVDPHATGKCEAMEEYKECMVTVPCDSQFSPKCETANETAFCDSLKTTKRCRCEKPGPFTPVDGEGDAGDVKTPTTTN